MSTLILPKTGFYALDKAECSDMVEGVCYLDTTLDECIAKCKTSNEKCGIGFHLKLKDGHTICGPVRLDLFNGVNPAHGLAPQKEFPLIKGDLTTFIDTSVIEYPPQDQNVVFYSNLLELVTSTGKYVSFTQKSHHFLSPNPFRLTITLPINLNFRLDMYKPLLYGSAFNIAVPQTTLFLRKAPFADKLIFSIDYASSGNFCILPLSKNKMGSPVNYNERFILVYDSVFVVDQHLNLLYMEPTEAHTFMFNKVIVL